MRAAITASRLEAIGYIGDRLHVVIYSLRADVVRIISLRKANAREVKRYAEAQAGDDRPHP
jgi:uncharacterized DUF497 family protein